MFFEATGSDGKTRIFSVDSKDGFVGQDFNSGAALTCSTDSVTSCSSVQHNHGYAVWDGTRWNVQYRADGCPKLFVSAQACLPMHLGGARYKMYFGDPSISTGKVSSSLDLQVAYLTITDGVLVPVAVAAILLNP